MLKFSLKVKIPVACRSLALWLIFATLAGRPQPLAAQSTPLGRGALDPFSNDYLFLEIGRNDPQAFTMGEFKAGGYHPIVGYRFNLAGEWLMGVGGQFKNFQRREQPGVPIENRNLALWTLYHEGLYVLRLDHPTYFLIGPKFLYLLPAKAAALPLVKDDSYNVEIGGALSASLVRILDNRAFLSLRVDRWRGTKTMKLQGLEFSLGYGWPLSGAE